MTSFYFHQIPNEIIGIIYDTNLDEAKNTFYLSNIEYIGIILTVIYISFIIFIKEGGNYKNKYLFLLQLCIFPIIILNPNNPIKETYNKVYDNREILRKNIVSLDVRKNFHWNAVNNYEGKQTVVIFLGETHRADYLSINGYTKQTTPLLEDQNIISFTDAISQAAYTLPSTPMILSRKSVNDIGLFSEKSIISAFKEAGFETWYISYLSQAHIGDNEINLLANEATHYVRSNVNVTTLNKILSEKSSKKLIIYKTIGSHFLYHNRYPENYSIFKPDFNDKTYTVPTIDDKLKLENSYANSILYSVDKQVNEFIESLKKEEGLVSLSFISDHGTAIYDDKKSLYGGNTKGNYKIGLFFWFNDNYRHLYNKKLNILQNNKNNKITSECFVDTILEIGLITTEYKKGCNLFNINTSIENRLVRNKEIYHYDDLDG